MMGLYAVPLWIAAALLMGSAPAFCAPSEMRVTGDWEVTVTAGTLRYPGGEAEIGRPAVLRVAPTKVVRMQKQEKLPVWPPDAAPWARGLRLDGLRTSETAAPEHLVPGTLSVKAARGSATVYERGKDYEYDEQWGTIGRLAGGSIADGADVWLDYSVWNDRIDSIVLYSGKPVLRRGEPAVVIARQPDLKPGEVRLANIWVHAGLKKLAAENIYPIVEPEYPEPQHLLPPAQTLLPKSWKKLAEGQPLKIMAWGDSVTAGGEASAEKYRWQNVFVEMLRSHLPKADVQLTTVAWGGRTTESFLNEPPGSQYNFREKVLGAKPDLIISEFVNDSYLTPERVEERYGYLLQCFREIGAEWIILTPHYVWHVWMNKPNARIEEDPRPYVAGLRQFAAKHNVALADASLRWGHLARQGIPYETLLVNALNHPDDHGHRLFALSLMELFR